MCFGQGFCSPRTLLYISNVLFGFICAVSSSQAQETTPAKPPTKKLECQVRIVEIPSEQVEALVEDWQLLGGMQVRPTESEAVDVANATFNDVDGRLTSAISAAGADASISFRKKQNLAVKEIKNLLASGTIVAAPRFILTQGKEEQVFLGSEKEFITAMERVDKPEGGKPTWHPKTTVIQDGISLNLLAISHENGKVDLSVKYRESSLDGEVQDFTLKTEGKEFTVQQPSLNTTSLSFFESIRIGEMFAMNGKKRIREFRSESRVPVLGKVPVIGKLFKNSKLERKSFTTILLVQCLEVDPKQP
ncbi:MAG: hypothetical protein AAF483_19295, partial [Planctomycetota bacterium]